MSPYVSCLEGQVSSGLLLLCDHASNHIPQEYRNLGLVDEQLQRHIAYDIGVAEVTRSLSRAFNAPAVFTHFSRLLIDPNRGLQDPTLVMQISDGAIVPGNKRISCHEINNRIEKFYQPYDQAIKKQIKLFQDAGIKPFVFSVHSFTPCWKDRPRPWHVGLLSDTDQRMTKPLIEAFLGQNKWCVGDNEPYCAGLPGDTIDRHATRHGFKNALIEIRQDLIDTCEGAQEWAEHVEKALRDIMPFDQY